MKQVIVMGPPRSGTSVITRLLQENLGVMMDEGPIRKDRLNPKGFYEDPRVVKINSIVLKNWKMGTGNEKRMNPLWIFHFAKWVKYRTLKYPTTQWGFKEPRCVGFVGWVKQFFDHPIWIVTDRSDKQIIKSQVEKLGVPREFARVGLDAYRKLIRDNIAEYALFDMSTYQKESDLTARLRKILWQ
jgi:hypothetical protein